MATLKKDNNTSQDRSFVDTRYDEMPYISSAFTTSHPNMLRTIGELFGLKTVPLKKARVLELGGSSGNNVIPIAENYSKSEVICIDLSTKQIETGQKLVDEAGLKNVQLKHCSIMDIDESFGKFDYIICHGVYSWVPDVVKDKILQICKDNLSPQGLAYISYNVLPGWNIARTAMDMMKYHASHFDNIQEQLVQAKLMLEFATSAVEDINQDYAKMLSVELKTTKNQGDHYVRHEYLSEDNDAIYFHEFNRRIKEKGLAYLGDSNFSTMAIRNYPEKVSKHLGEIKDIIRMEQYLDFINNRRFRHSIICHDNLIINRNLNPEVLSKFLFNLVLSELDDKDKANLKNNEQITFKSLEEGKFTLTTSSPIMKAAIHSFIGDGSKFVNIDEIIKRVCDSLDLKKVEEKASVKNEILVNFLNLVVSGHLSITIEEQEYITNVSDKPKAPEYIRLLAKDESIFWVTNQRHQKVGINFLEKLMLQALNGKNNLDQIISEVLVKFKEKGYNINREDVPITDEKEQKEILSQEVKKSLEKFAGLALLIA